MYYVAVLKKDGTPASPTTRGGRVRHLLKSGKARVVRTRPFTIQLLYNIGKDLDTETLGIDPGRTNIGIASVKDDGTCTLKTHVRTRNKDIPKLMKTRAMMRRKHRDTGRRDKKQRRARAAKTVVKGEQTARMLPGCKKPVVCKFIRNRKARFNNRARKKGWLTPTARHLLETHLSAIEDAVRMRPVKRIVVELNRFAFMALDHLDVKKPDYCHGPLYGHDGLHEAVSSMQGGHCLMCNGAIDHYHHIVPRSKCGSDTIGNIAGLCTCCHDRIHKDAVFAGKLAAKKGGLNKKYGVLSVFNQIIPFLMAELVRRYPDIEIAVTNGWSTQSFRENHQVDKTHDNDAYCIACSALTVEHPKTWTVDQVCTYEVRQFRRQDRMACHKEMLDRKYTDGTGKVVCVNRRKAIEQKTDSLEEYRQTHIEGEVSRLHVVPHTAIYKDPMRIMPGAVMAYTPKPNKTHPEREPYTTYFILQRTDGRHNGIPDYCIGTDEKRYGYKQCSVVRRNTGLVFL